MLKKPNELVKELGRQRVATYVLPIAVFRIFVISGKSFVFYGEP
jgi:hypothetical protein